MRKWKIVTTITLISIFAISVISIGGSQDVADYEIGFTPRVFLDASALSNDFDMSWDQYDEMLSDGYWVADDVGSISWSPLGGGGRLRLYLNNVSSTSNSGRGRARNAFQARIVDVSNLGSGGNGTANNWKNFTLFNQYKTLHKAAPYSAGPYEADLQYRWEISQFDKSDAGTEFTYDLILLITD